MVIHGPVRRSSGRETQHWRVSLGRRELCPDVAGGVGTESIMGGGMQSYVCTRRVMKKAGEV